MLPALPGPELERVSPGLKAKLVHAGSDDVLYGVRYSPDGGRIIAGGYPGGIVQVWDPETGRSLLRIDAGSGYRATAHYFRISPGWSRLYAPTNGARKSTPVERNGKRLRRWEFDSEVRAWDLSSGELIDTYRHEPPRNIRLMALAPDGSTFLTGEELPGEVEGGPERNISLWALDDGQPRSLAAGRSLTGTYSRDSRTVAVEVMNEDWHTTALKLYDTRALTEKLTIPIRQQFASVWIHWFTPGDRGLLGLLRVFPSRNERQTSERFLKLWDTATGEELASFPVGEVSFAAPVSSPDGRIAAIISRKQDEIVLHLLDLHARRMLGSAVVAGKPPEGEQVIPREPAFTPDGKWLAVATQVFPDNLGRREPRPEELPQPRIHLVDIATCAVRETLVAPQSIVGCLCFSPDGQTLAAGADGKILLWDTSQRLAAGSSE